MSKFRKKLKKWEVDDKEIQIINQKLTTLSEVENIDTFSKYPLSRKTLSALKEFGYVTPTEIQRESIILGLKGLDILGSAKTGSGKTLAFLIPVLENLYRASWTNLDGLGALIISPTRELAYQTFEVLKKIGKNHDFSAGIVIGGKDLHFEKQKIYQTNILVATPGRLLQHLEQTSFFACDSLKILVLDEADRILDLGFQHTINAIIESIPKERQSLLYSATQTKSVQDLARLSLKQPIYISTNEDSSESTPSQLFQTYLVCELHEKLSYLYSFIKTHLKQKILIFLTSCKQVKYVYSLLCRLKPGMSVLALHGTMNQIKRVASYEQFSRKDSASCLIATDIAARGLDFPEVHWVVQMDCPEDVNTYIHRVGRTARYHKDGKSLIFLMPSEEPTFLKYLQAKHIPIKRTNINPQRLLSVQGKVESECARDINLKQRAQKCFISYLRAIFLMKDKKLFDITKLDTDKYAHSLGLAIPPRIRFLQKKGLSTFKSSTVNKDPVNITNNDSNRTKFCLNDDNYNLDNKSDIDKDTLNNINTGPKYGQSNITKPIENDIMQQEVNQLNVKNTKKLGNFSQSLPEDSSIFTLKPKPIEEMLLENRVEPDKIQQSSNSNLLINNSLSVVNRKPVKSSRITEAKKLAKMAKARNIQLNTRITFKDDIEDESDTKTNISIGQTNGIGAEKSIVNTQDDEVYETYDIEQAKKRLREQDIIDKKAYREKIKARHKEKRLKEREARKKLANKHSKATNSDHGNDENVDNNVTDQMGNESDYDSQSNSDGKEPTSATVEYAEILEEDPILADIVDSLPDPDKIYNNDNNNLNNYNNHKINDSSQLLPPTNSDSFSPVEKASKTKKNGLTHSEKGIKRKKKSVIEEGMDTQRSLLETEALAFKILNDNSTF